MRKRLRKAARDVTHYALVLWLAARDRRTPWLARSVSALAAAYVFSPIQLLPNWIPVLGYADDVTVVALGSWIALKLMPAELVEELRAKANSITDQPTDWRAAVVILLVWIVLSLLLAALVWKLSAG